MRRPPSHRRPTTFRDVPYGVCYYPEHWDAATRAHDAERMAAAGVNIVRMGEFAWDMFEPEPGRFDFAFHQDAVAHLGRHGISTILCTPTATPPAWLTHRHPEILRVDAKGLRMEHGSRQHASHHAPAFRAASRAITTAMADAFRASPHVVGWQTDNELHCHFSEDHSTATQDAFRDWLRLRYGADIAVLNRAWGTAFWAQTYRDFSEITTPKDGLPTYPNPSARLDYLRFLADTTADFQGEQVAILRAANPAWWVTHNGVFGNLDYRGRFGDELDVMGWDAYPGFIHDPVRRQHWQALRADNCRALTGNFLVPEQQAGPGGQAGYLHDTPEPGEMRMMAWHSIARGADGLLFFRWRTCRFGAEMHWYGILDHDNVPRRRYDELAHLGDDLRRLGPALLGTTVRVDAAVAGADYQAVSMEKSMPIGLPGIDRAQETIHQGLWRAGFAAGIVHPADDLGGVRLYVVPHWEWIDPAWVPHLADWVNAGGILVLSARCGIRTTDGHMTADTLPGTVRTLAGCTVAETCHHNHPGRRSRLAVAASEIDVEHWSEILVPDPGTTVEGVWRGRFRDGRPAITRRPLGRGAVWYVGAWLTTDLWAALQPRLAAEAGLTPMLAGLPDTVTVTVRSCPGRRLWFLINHQAEPVSVPVPSGRDLLAGGDVGGTATLGAYGVMVVQDGG